MKKKSLLLGMFLLAFSLLRAQVPAAYSLHMFDGVMQSSTESAWPDGGASLAITPGGHTGSYCLMTLSWASNYGGVIYIDPTLDPANSIVGTTGLRVYIKYSDVAAGGLHLSINGTWKNWFDFSKLPANTWGKIDIPWSSISIDPATFAITQISLRIAQDATTGTSPTTIGIDDIQYYGPLSTGINELNTNDQSLNIYPNPVTNGIVNFSKEVKNIYIFNSLGALVKNVERAKTIDVSDLSTGIYFVKTSLGNSKLFITN